MNSNGQGRLHGRVAVITGGDEGRASEFAELLFSPDGRRLLRDSGFLPPD